MSTASRLISYEESLLLPEDKLTEIVKGEQRRMPPPWLNHARLVDRLATLLRRKLQPDKFEVLAAPFGQLILAEPLTYRIPDLAVYLRDRLPEDEQYVSAIPELLVEVLSPASRKGPLEELIEDYAAIGAPELWLIRPDQRMIERRLLRNGKLEPSGSFTSGDLAPQFAPECTLAPGELFA